MATVGIESSAHTFGVGVVENGRVLANVKSMFRISGGGLIPMKVADFHQKHAGSVIKRALREAGVERVDSVGYTKGPGLGPCLRVGQLSALTLSRMVDAPLYPVNHAAAHIEVTRHIYGLSDPLVLYVSGGNSQILGLEDRPYRHYHVYGETFDVGVGNMLDSFAREAKLKPAWGSSVSRLAEGGKYIDMPYTVKGMDFTFTGLLTNAGKLLKGNDRKDVAFSLQETAFSMLCEATERALLLTGKEEVIACGGVAQSRRLTEMLKAMAESHGRKFYVAPDEFNSDNGAMIAIVAEKMHKSGRARAEIRERAVRQKYRIEEFGINWR